MSEETGEVNKYRGFIVFLASLQRIFELHRRIKLLNVEVDDVAMDELVETFREGVMLTLHVDMIMKLHHRFASMTACVV